MCTNYSCHPYLYVTSQRLFSIISAISTFVDTEIQGSKQRNK